MKKRIQITVGPQSQKLLLKVVRKTSLETGIPVTVVDALEGFAAVGLNQTVMKMLTGSKSVKSLRE